MDDCIATRKVEDEPLAVKSRKTMDDQERKTPESDSTI